MSSETCSHFQLHAWKKDTCANCLKPKRQHKFEAIPQPAKRISKISVVEEVLQDKEKVQVSDKVQAKLQNPEKSLAEIKQSSFQEKRQSTIGSPKPVPLKAKPQLVSKQEKSKKSGANTEDTEKSTEQEALDVTQNFDKSCEAESRNERVVAAQRINRPSQRRPQIMPPQVPDPSRLVNATSAGSSKSLAETLLIQDDLRMSQNSKAKAEEGINLHNHQQQLQPASCIDKSSTSHYYQVYDIAAKGLSGTPEPFNESDSNEVPVVGEKRKQTDWRGFHAGTGRVMEVQEEQNVAVPYTIVDVTMCHLNKDQLDIAPPQLPSVPAPNRDGFLGMHNTLPSKRPPVAKEGVDLLNNTQLSGSMKALHRSLVSDIAKTTLGDSSSGLLPNVSEFQERKLLQESKTQQDLYEDINNTSNAEKDKVSDPQTLSGLRSTTFEARVAAMAKLDLGKGIAPVAKVTEDQQQERHSSQKQLVEMNENRLSDVTMTAGICQQEKSRKTGSMSFFQKFLKRGNRDTAVESQCKSSGMNISIEPIINMTTFDQSTIEPKVDVFNKVEDGVEISSSGTFQDRLTSKQQRSTDSLVKCELSSSIDHVVSSEENGIFLDGGTGSTCDKSSCNSENKEHTSADNKETIPHILPNVSKKQSPRCVSVNKNFNEVSNEVNINLFKDSLPTILDQQNVPLVVSQLHQDMVIEEDAKLHLTSTLKDSVDSKDKESTNQSDSQCLDDQADSAAGKNKLQKESKTSKASRKSIAPPPMAPPPPPPPPCVTSAKDQDFSRSSSPKFSRNLEIEPPSLTTVSSLLTGSSTQTKPMKQIEQEQNLAEDGGEKETLFSLSHTLPRTSFSAASSNSNGQKMLAGIGLRQLDSATKHARNKTVSEGVRFEKLLITAQDGLEENGPEEMTTLTLDRRVNKFLYRALPALPPNETTFTSSNNCLEEIDNLYELVSQTDNGRQCIKKEEDEQLTYEDIDIYCAQNNHSSSSKASSSNSHSTGSATNQQQGLDSLSSSSVLPSNGPLTETASACAGYYLEPVSGTVETKSQGKAQLKDDWRPCPAPRGSHLSKTLINQDLAMPYVNTTMINNQLPLNTNDGFDTLAGLTDNMLYHLTDRLYTNYITRFLRNRSDVTWTDFELLDLGKPQLVQGSLLFYQAKHLVLAPSGCILMVSKDVLEPNFCLEPNHANVISPLLCFTVSPSDMANLIRPIDEPSLPTTNGTAAVLLLTSVINLDSYWEEAYKKTSTAETDSCMVQFEQSICHCFVQILNALLYLRESGCYVLRLTSDDVVMALYQDRKWHPFVKPAVITFDVCFDQDCALLGDDLAQLLFQMLKLETARTEKVEAKLAFRTKYSRGLQRVIRILQQKTWEDLAISRNLLEFLLWGPSEDEAKFVALTEKRETSFRVWLEVARCKMVSELVLEPLRHSLEIANQAKFLCRVTENSLLEVTKLLFE